MIAHNWSKLAGWRTIPGPAATSQQAHHHHHLRCSSANAATGGTTTLMHNSCLAPANLQHEQSGAPRHHRHQVGAQPPHSITFPLWVQQGAWLPCKSTPGWEGDFLQTCEFGRAAVLRPMAARLCSPAPALGNVLVMAN